MWGYGFLDVKFLKNWCLDDFDFDSPVEAQALLLSLHLFSLPFAQIIYPPERSEDDPVDADVVKASLTGADFLSMLPFMWPRPVKDMQEGHPETPQEKEESKAYSAFYAETVSAFIAANRAFLEGGGSRACKAALAPWLEYLRATVGGSGDPDAPPRLRCKMFLFCVLAWVWFGRDTPQDRRCHALCESLDAIAAILKLDDRETRLFAAFADPQAFYDCDTGRRDDITINFFKSEARVQEDKRQRAVILGMIANVLGMPRGSHVFHTHLFNPSKLSGTCGLGSAYTNTIGTVHYDCGTILQPDTGVWERGWREPLTDKGVLASLYIPTFGIVAVGLLLFPEEHAGSYGPVFSRFYNTASDNWGRGTSAKARDEKDWLINFVNSRTVAGHTVMAEQYVPNADIVLLGARTCYRQKYSPLCTNCVINCVRGFANVIACLSTLLLQCATLLGRAHRYDDVCRELVQARGCCTQEGKRAVVVFLLCRFTRSFQRFGLLNFLPLCR